MHLVRSLLLLTPTLINTSKSSPILLPLSNLSNFPIQGVVLFLV